tara:strand:+ start:488 stop:610 length:123 start_codon:yes stop_codon:yes gene_type:complete
MFQVIVITQQQEIISLFDCFEKAFDYAQLQGRSWTLRKVK